MSSPEPDVIDLLLTQHEAVRQQFIWVLGARGTDKLELFAQLVEMLQRHEKTEQEIVHAAVAALGADGREIVDELVAEEQDADRLILTLTDLGVQHHEFDGKLAELHAAVLAHAAHEEEQEFPRLRETVPAEQLRAMTSQVRIAQTTHW